MAVVIQSEEGLGASAVDPRAQLGTLWRHPILRAVLKAVLTILVATVITFALIRLLPGNPIDLRIDELTRDGAMTYEQARDQVSATYPIDLSDPIPELSLPARVNPELVSIVRPDGPQQTFLRSLVAQHAELTGSARSAELLADWKEHAHKFWRIAPKAEVAKIEGSHEGSAKQAKA